jgi:hypothetical protein
MRGLIGEMMAKQILTMLGVCCLVLIAVPSGASAEEAETTPPEVGEEADTGEEADPVPERSITSPDDRDAGRYAVRLRDLETRISMLQEQIYRSKARLSLLAESVISGVIAGSKAVIVHRNEMGNSFRLVRAVFALDGAPIFSRTGEDGEAIEDSEEIELFNGSIVPGEHTLSVSLEYRGHGYGIFSYLKGYTFKVRSSHAFTAAEGKLIQLRVVAYEKGGPTTPLEDRPDVRYVERIDSVTSAVAEAPTGGGEEE